MRKPKKAVALKYDSNDDKAPKVKAKGSGHMAKRILDVAKENNITIYNDPDLIEILSQIDINREIPSEVYKVVAEIFSFVYRINGKFKKN